LRQFVKTGQEFTGKTTDNEFHLLFIKPKILYINMLDYVNEEWKRHQLF
jgi:hypothetical protein